MNEILNVAKIHTAISLSFKHTRFMMFGKKYIFLFLNLRMLFHPKSTNLFTTSSRYRFFAELYKNIHFFFFIHTFCKHNVNLNFFHNF